MRLLVQFFAVLILVAGTASANGIWRPTHVTSTPFDPRQSSEVADSTDAFLLSSDNPEFGGFSGAGWRGDSLFLISDRGSIWRVEAKFSDTGSLDGFGQWFWAPVHEIGRKAKPDLEALAIGADGRMYVAVEGKHAVFELRENGDRFVVVPGPATASLAPSPSNKGIESLALSGNGEFIAVSEGKRRADGLHAAVRLESDGTEHSWGYSPANGFDPTDAIWLDDGRIFVLERRFGLVSGWQAKIAEIHLSDSTTARTEVASFAHERQTDNFEALAMRKSQGTWRATIVSDDNFSFLQSTLLFDWSLR